jgi:DNA-binding phage protein
MFFVDRFSIKTEFQEANFVSQLRGIVHRINNLKYIANKYQLTNKPLLLQMGEENCPTVLVIAKASLQVQTKVSFPISLILSCFEEMVTRV